MMLIIEYAPNGDAKVKVVKDWHSGRIGRSYMPPRRNYMADVNVDSRSRKDMWNLQSSLLRAK